MKTLVFSRVSEQGMRTLGKHISARLQEGMFLALYGGLGAGKTTLTQAIAEGLGITDIQSPTFTIVREHSEGALPLFHFDAYRLADADELYAIGFEDYLAKNGVIIMEWGENVSDALPGERLDILIHGSGSELREVSLNARGKRYETLLEGI